jgi:DeoR/GlpR family transcriptional regulator of sugar metabolism
VRYTQASARRDELRRQLDANGYISSAQAAAELSVSEMTIRRDLRRLHAEGHAHRVVGGASLPGWHGQGLPFEERDRAGNSDKRALAICCADYLQGIDAVALDAGTTVAPLAGLLSPGTTVVTHSVPAITASTGRADVKLIALGGFYQSDTRAFAGPMTRAALDHLSVDVAVLSATAVDDAGLLCANILDAEIKRGLSAIAGKTILLVDHTKIGGRAPIRFGSLESVDLVITDAGASESQRRLLGGGGAQVLVAPREAVR